MTVRDSKRKIYVVLFGFSMLRSATSPPRIRPWTEHAYYMRPTAPC